MASKIDELYGKLEDVLMKIYQAENVDSWNKCDDVDMKIDAVLCDTRWFYIEDVAGSEGYKWDEESEYVSMENRLAELGMSERDFM